MDGRGMNFWLPAQVYLWCYWQKVAFSVLRGVWMSPLPHSSTAGPERLLPITPAPCPAQAPPEEWQLCTELTVGNCGELHRIKHVCGAAALCARKCGGKSCWKRWSVCQLMLTRLLILFISDLAKIPRHPKDKVWKLCRKLVPLKNKQTMNPWSNYTRNFPDFSAVM